MADNSTQDSRERRAKQHSATPASNTVQEMEEQRSYQSEGSPSQEGKLTDSQDGWRASSPEESGIARGAYAEERRRAADYDESRLYSDATGYRPYVRQRTPHRTQEAIDDYAADGASGLEGYTHDSNITIRGGAFSGREYRRMRSKTSALQNSRYGQYLEVPKGRRSIFSSRERARKRRSVLVLIVLVIALVLVALLVMRMVG